MPPISPTVYPASSQDYIDSVSHSHSEEFLPAAGATRQHYVARVRVTVDVNLIGIEAEPSAQLRGLAAAIHESLGG